MEDQSVTNKNDVSVGNIPFAHSCVETDHQVRVVRTDWHGEQFTILFDVGTSSRVARGCNLIDHHENVPNNPMDRIAEGNNTRIHRKCRKARLGERTLITETKNPGRGVTSTASQRRAVAETRCRLFNRGSNKDGFEVPQDSIAKTRQAIHAFELFHRRVGTRAIRGTTTVASMAIRDG